MVTDGNPMRRSVSCVTPDILFEIGDEELGLRHVIRVAEDFTIKAFQLACIGTV